MLTTPARTGRAAALGAGVGLFGALLTLTPYGFALEEGSGLDWLFQLRGPRAAPAEVVIVALDRESAERLSLPNRPDQWPRSLHARLVERLARHGAAVVAFDIIFDRPREPRDDALFADAVARAGNVVLFEYLRKEPGPGNNTAVVVEQLVPPLPGLAQAAAALAPFPLPKVPVKLSQYWTFRAGALEQPTLPVVAFQLHALSAYDDWRALLHAAAPSVAAQWPADRRALLRARQLVPSMLALRAALRAQPQTAARLRAALAARVATLDPARARLLASLIDLYSQDGDTRYLDFYGPPRGITTLPYHRVLDDSLPAAASLAGKLVIVGFAERWQPEQQDGFHTAFSQPDSGLDISGAEIAATAAANLLEDRPVRPLPWARHLALVFGWGLMVGVLSLLGRARLALALVFAVAALYFVFAQQQFARSAHWYPLVIPLLLQVPLALFAAAWWRYHETNRERAVIRKAFGYHLPNKVVDQLARNMGNLEASRELLYGACLASDAARYTTLSERLDPATLAALMNRYYEALFGPVRAHGGTVSDVVGDAMLAIWAGARPDQALRAHACRAALEVARAAHAFGNTPGNEVLPTRIGVHAGQVLLGHVGGADHFEYRAVGDIVNTANRIQALNKPLGTNVLVSSEALADVQGLVTREVGTFLLAGKTKPILVHELSGTSTEVDPDRAALCQRFAAALSALRAGRWEEAAVSFMKLSHDYPDDGPSRFYRELSERYRAQPPAADWNGVVHIDSK